MKGPLDGMVVVVTGAFGSLGRAVAEAAQARGARIARIDQRLPAQAAGHDDVVAAADLASPADAARAIDDVAARCGRIDALVNVAGGFSAGAFADSDLADWQTMFRINLMTCVCASRAALPHLQRGAHGRIVNVSAGAASRAAAGMGAYAASKAGVARFTEALADELKLQRITVNAVLPAVIDTPANRLAMPKAKFDRWVAPAAIADVICFLLSGEAADVTGTLIPVTGRM